MKRLLRSLWFEPRPAPKPRSRADWTLLGVLSALTLVEVLVRDDLHAGTPTVLGCLALLPTVLWRRSHPLLVTALVFSVTGVFEVVGFVTGREGPDVHAQGFVLILPFALCRWGSGREVLLGLPIVLASATAAMIADEITAGEAVAGLTILLGVGAFGAASRYRDAARRRELADVRAGERMSLARELHDTVAHHVSAIAVRAQAGIAASPGDPRAALDALQVIGDEASRTLTEMREMVRVLRDGEAAALAPMPRVEDLEGLTGTAQGRARVEVALRGDTAELSPALSGAVYRLARESITNARRHARGATTIRVEVSVDESSVRLRVQDDGEAATPGAEGFGLMGMTERAALLGGTLEAGPGPERGWTVSAVLPRTAVDASP